MAVMHYLTPESNRGILSNDRPVLQRLAALSPIVILSILVFVALPVIVVASEVDKDKIVSLAQHAEFSCLFVARWFITSGITRPVMVFKHVYIVNVSKYEKKSPTILDVVMDGNRHSGFNGIRETLSTDDKRLSVADRILGIPIVWRGRRNLVWSDNHESRIGPSYTRGRMPEVLNFEIDPVQFNFDATVAGQRFNQKTEAWRPMGHFYVGSLNGSGALGSFFDKFICRSPEFLGVENKSGSNCGQRDSSRCDKSIEDKLPWRFFIGLIGLLTCAYLNFRGLEYVVDHKRSLTGRLLQCLGYIAGFGGMGLLWATGFRSTWCWWI